MRINNVLLATAVVGISGCATSVPEKWYHPQVTDSSQQMYRFSEDMRVCMDVAQGSAPMPSARIEVPPQQEAYNFRANVTTYGSNGIQNSTVYGRATPAPSFASGFASGYNAVSGVAEDFRRNKLKETYVSCMKMLGWTDKKPDSLPREVGEACTASSECDGTLVCSKVSAASMQCMSSDVALRSMN